VKSSTATGTTATAETAAQDASAPAQPAPAYRGRFAPSPTGLLHHGSLLAALASWLDARAHGGAWLVRMEDLDAARNIPGADEQILRTLDSLGLIADGPVIYQSTRLAAYQAALRELHARNLAYRCTCSRSDEPGVYSGHCRRHPPPPGPAAWRFAMPAGAVQFVDELQGGQRFAVDALGDPVILRRDGVPAYQLAVVVDDAFQGITHVVRGSDLLESTAWQLAIGQGLGTSPLRYLHLPLVVEPDGSKLAKSRRSRAVAEWAPGAALVSTLELLGYTPPPGLAAEAVPRILDWALAGWPPEGLAGLSSVALPA
jgi:glutamyl-Q tRNA(Asp) synthetase